MKERFRRVAWDDGTRIDVVAVSLIGLSAVLRYFVNLGHSPVAIGDEAIYADVARRMAEDDHWLIPRFAKISGPEPLVELFLQKPPLVFWLQGISIELFGPTAFAVRLPSAVAALALCFVVYAIGRDLGGRWVAIPSALFFVVIPPVTKTHAARYGATDMLLVLSGTVFVWLVWRNRHKANDQELIAAGVAAGLAVMTKGVGAGIFLAVVAPILVLHWRTFGSKTGELAAAATAAIALPWHLAALWFAPRVFVDQYLLDQVIARSTTGLGYTPGDPLFDFMHFPYFKILPQYFGLALPVIIASVVIAALAVQYSSLDYDWSEYLFLVWFVALPPVFFAVVGGNHLWYLLPMAVPAALLVGLAAGSVAETVVYELSIADSAPHLQVGYLLAGALVVIVITEGVVIPQGNVGPTASTDMKSLGADTDAVPADELVLVDPTVRKHYQIKAFSFYTGHDLCFFDRGRTGPPETRYAVLTNETREELDDDHQLLGAGEVIPVALMEFDEPVSAGSSCGV